MLLQEVDGTSLKVGKEKRAGGALFLCACGKEGGNVWPNVAIDAIDGWEIEKDV